MSEKKSFVEKLMPAVGKMQENIYVSAITAGMMNAMPVLMASAIFQLFYSFPIPAWTNFLQSIGLYGLLTTVVNVCNLTALFIVFGIGRALGDKKGVDGVQCGLSALLCFLIITPLDVMETGTYINTSSLGAQGIFTAIIVAMVAPSLYAFCIRKNIVIKMPSAVPEFVSKSFSGIPASLVTVVPFVVIRGLFSMTSCWGSFTGFIYQVVQTPFTALGNSLPAHLIAMFVCCFLWWCGMHGTMVVFGACMAIWTAPHDREPECLQRRPAHPLCSQLDVLLHDRSVPRRPRLPVRPVSESCFLPPRASAIRQREKCAWFPACSTSLSRSSMVCPS